MAKAKNRGYLSCALDFERATGIKNIGRHYVMPDGLSLKEMQILRVEPINKLYGVRQIHKIVNGQRGLALEDPANTSKVHKIYDQWVNSFRRRNPELRTVQLDGRNLRQLYDMTMGVVSGINPQDIDFFINEFKKRSAFMESLKTLRERSARVFGIELPETWIPSPHTASRIEQACERREKKKLHLK